MDQSYQDSFIPKAHIKTVQYKESSNVNTFDSIRSILHNLDSPFSLLNIQDEPRTKGSIRIASSLPRLPYTPTTRSPSSPCAEESALLLNQPKLGSFSKQERFPKVNSNIYPGPLSSSIFSYTSSFKGRFSSTERFPSSQSRNFSPGPGNYNISRLFDDQVSTRHEKFLQILEGVRKQDEIEKIRLMRMVERSELMEANALHTAARRNDTSEIARILTDTSFNNNINVNDKLIPEGYTALHLATIKNNVESVVCLISRLYEPHNSKERPRGLRLLEQIDIDIQDVKGNSPLHIASIFGYLDIVGLLCDAGANLHVKNKQGFTPLQVCKNQRIYQEIMIAVTREKLKHELATGQWTKEKVSSSSSVVSETGEREPQRQILHSFYLGFDNSAADQVIVLDGS